MEKLILEDLGHDLSVFPPIFLINTYGKENQDAELVINSIEFYLGKLDDVGNEAPKIYEELLDHAPILVLVIGEMPSSEILSRWEKKLKEKLGKYWMVSLNPHQVMRSFEDYGSRNPFDFAVWAGSALLFEMDKIHGKDENSAKVRRLDYVSKAIKSRSL